MMDGADKDILYTQLTTPILDVGDSLNLSKFFIFGC